MAKAPVTSTPNGKNMELLLTGVRLSFVDVFDPIQGTNDQGQPTDRFYLSTNILIPKTGPEGEAQRAALNAALKHALAAEWGENPPAIPTDRRCVQDGEPIDPNTVDEGVAGSGTRRARWDGYEGHFYISANKPLKSKTKADALTEVADRNPIQILGPKKTAKDDSGNPIFPRLKEVDGLIYSGCYADVIVQIYPYNGTGKGPNGKNLPHRLNASIEAIKFSHHGTPFGGKKVDAQSIFAEEPDDEMTGSAEAGAGAAATAAADDMLG
jgi:hypothetical protein